MMMVLVGIAAWGIMHGPRSRVYDCSLAEFHPDFPVAVREECRRIKREASK
jgi:predicted carbohydrate-binding protein with CBM5 and CBM33 domain